MAYDSTTKKITAPVAISDLQQCLGMVSGNLGYLIRYGSINMWARYKPIPCLLQNANNTPQVLTEQQRAEENYGIEPIIDYFSADIVQKLEDYVNSVDVSNPYGAARPREWATGMYYRLSDFAKVTNDRVAVSGKGYDPYARPTDVIVKVGGTAFQVRPLIPADERIINVAVNGRFEFPNDRFWMPTYYYITFGSQQPSEADNVTIGNDEWLSVLDLITGSRFSSIISAQQIRRGLAIFKQEWDSDVGDYIWKYQCRIWDGDTSNLASRTFEDYPDAFADFTDTSTTVLHGEKYVNSLAELEGEYLFCDLWYLYYASGVAEYQPIIGYCYKANINRSSAVWNVDVEGGLIFTSVEIQSETNASSLVLHFDYNPNVVDIPVGIYDDPPTDYTARTAIVTALQNHYSSLTVTVNGSTYDILTGIIESFTDTHASSDHGWSVAEHGGCVIYNGPLLSIPSGSQATITAQRNDIGYTGTLTKTVDIEGSVS